MRISSPREDVPEGEIVVWPFEVSREVVVLPDVWDSTAGLLHQLQSVFVQASCHLHRREEATQREGKTRGPISKWTVTIHLKNILKTG